MKLSHNSSPDRIGVFMPTWVGDACMATPTLLALRSKFPATKLAIISRPVISELLQDSGDPSLFDECLNFRKDLRGRLDLVRGIKHLKLDTLILLPNSFWTAMVARLAGVPTIVGYARSGRSLLLTRQVKPIKEGKVFKPVSAIDYYLRLAGELGCSTENRQTLLGCDESSKELANLLWKKAGFDENCKTVVVNSNAATDPSRVWPVGRVIALAEQLAEQAGVQVLLHCDPRERDMANEIAASIAHPKIKSMGICEDLPIGLSKAVLGKADVVVTTDSGARHMAVAAGSRVVSLFGSTHPDWTRTYNQPEQIVLPNAPAGTETRDLMNFISVDRVMDATLRCLNSSSVAA